MIRFLSLFITRIYKYNLKILFFIIFFELIYLFRDKSLYFFSYNKSIDQKKYKLDTPTPYYFLFLINSILKKFKTYDKIFVDIGSGKGRVLKFFSKHFNKKLIGVEINHKSYKQSKEYLKNIKMVSIYNKNFLDLKLNKKKNYVFYIGDAFQKSISNKIFKKISKLKNSLLIYYNPTFKKSLPRNFVRLKELKSGKKNTGFVICKII